MNSKKRFIGQAGQIGLITLLIMTVMLSVGISVVNRSTKDLRISRQEEEASKIFNGAEAGIEDGLKNLSSCTVDTPCSGNLTFGQPGTGDIRVNVSYTAVPVMEFEAEVPENTTATIDAGNQPVGGGEMVIEWGQNVLDCATSPAIEVMAYNTNPAVYTVRRQGYGGCDKGDKFEVVSDAGGDGYYRLVTIALDEDEKLVRIRPLYADTAIRVTASWLPTQYYRIRSTGTSEVGQETKVIEVTRTLPWAPSIFDYVLYSGGSLVK